MRRVNPAVIAPAQVIDHRVRITIAEIGVELGDGVGLAVTVGVTQEPHVRCRGGDDAILEEDKTRHALQALEEHLLLRESALPIRRGENRNAVQRGAVVIFSVGRDLVVLLPALHVIGRGIHPAAIGILRRLANPHAALRVPVDVHHLVDERLARRQRHLEIRMQFHRRRRLLGARRAALRITQRGQFGLGRELIDVGPLARPGDAAQQDGAEMRHGEVRVDVSGQVDEGTIRLRPARPGVLIDPHLRLDVIDRDLVARRFAARIGAARGGKIRRVGGGQHMHVRTHIQIVINFVRHVVVAGFQGDGMRAVHVVKRHGRFQPFGFAPDPRAANDRLEIRRAVARVVLRDRRRVNDHHAAAPLEKDFQSGAALRRNLPALLRVQDQHIRLGQLLGGGESHRAIRHAAALGEQLGPVAQELLVLVLAGAVGFFAAANEDAQRSLRGEKRRTGQNENQGQESCFHIGKTEN